MKKLIYTAHGGETMKYSEFIWEYVYKQGHIACDPFLIGPYKLWNNSVKGDKYQAAKDSIDIMLHCDELWLFGENKEDALKKSGVRVEYEAWKKERGEDTIRFVTWKEVGIPKYQEGGWDNIPKFT